MSQVNTLQRIFNAPITFFRDPFFFYNRLKYIVMSPFYQSIILPIKVKKVREKSVIDVLYVLNELGTWKTETMYLKMLNHSRFNPR